MPGHTEIELKWALTPEAHAALAGHLAAELGPAHVLRQENRFFDSADLRLRAQRMNLRLRLENDRLLMTCKQKIAHPGEAFRHQEWEVWLDPALWPRIGEPGLAALLPLPDHVRESLGGAALTALGGFANLRHEFHHRDELLCLDRTDFGHRVDHELEIETPTPEATSRTWGERLKVWGIPYSLQPTTKFARYLETRGHR